jgi:thymidylate synthase
MPQKAPKKQVQPSVPEQQFVDILKKIHDQGAWRPVKQRLAGQTVPEAKTVTGVQMRFQPEDGMPLTTLRSMKGAFYLFIGEMLWILSGNTGVDMLHKFNIRYWDDWCDEEHCGWYNLPVGEFGRTYGAQWRSFNAGGPQPIDQIKRLFDVIKKNPYDRGLIVNPWNPYDVDHIVIKPCHGQFRLLLVDDKWTMIVTQRSGDVPVGIPSNIVMYKFLQQLICMKTGYGEGELIYDIHDAHYYSDQEKGVEELISRAPKAYPTCTINPIMVEVLDAMLEGDADPFATKKFNPEQKPYNDLLKEWIILEGYDPHPPVPRDILPVAI